METPLAADAARPKLLVRCETKLRLEALQHTHGAGLCRLGTAGSRGAPVHSIPRYPTSWKHRAAGGRVFLTHLAVYLTVAASTQIGSGRCA